MSDEKRVVLVKPGDVLLIGNVGHISPAQVDPLRKALGQVGIRFVAFAYDIEIDHVTAERIQQLADLGLYPTTDTP